MSESNWYDNEWPVEYDEQGNPVRVRMDLVYLSLLVKELDSTGVVDEVKPVELFWEAWRPRAILLDVGGFDEDPPPLHPDKEKAFLEKLAELECRFRIQYLPDTDDWRAGTTVEQFKEGSLYIHMGAASALRRLRREGLFSDDVRQTLQEVSRVLYLLSTDQVYAYRDVLEVRGDFVSLMGIRALVLSAMSRIEYRDAEYEEAFKTAAEALVLFQDVSEAIGIEEEELLSEGIVQEDFQEQDRKIRAAIKGRMILEDFEPQEIVNAFEGLRMRGKSENWRLVEIICGLLAYTAADEMDLVKVADSDGQEKFWTDYWHLAAGWAGAQLSQNELREFLRQDRERASETALKIYFLRETWDNIPEKARDNLVYAERIWFESQRRDFGPVPIQIRIAVAAMCYEYIWEPLRSASGDQKLLVFVKKDAELKENKRSPNLADYIWVCRQRFFREFVQSEGLGKPEQEFLVSDAEGSLRNALRSLQEARNDAEHEHDSLLTRDKVKPLVDLFFGIGQPGVLRRLAEIGPKLAGK